MFRPIIAIAKTTIGEAIRRKVLLVILLIGLVVLMTAPALGILSTRSETTVLKGLMLGIIQLTSALIAIVLTVYMLPNEIERRTIYTILCKPVQRWQFLVGKYLGAIGALLLMITLMTMAMAIVFALNQYQSQGFDPAKILELCKAPMLFFVQMSLLAAVAVFFSTFVTPLVNFFLAGMVYLSGSLFAPFFDTIQQNSSTPPLAKAIANLVLYVLPNFSYYNVQNPIINPGQQIQNEMQYYINVSLYGLMYIVIMLLGGILLFDRREV